MAALAFRRRSRGNSLSAVTPPMGSGDYSSDLALLASRMLYKSPFPSPDDLPIYVMDSAAFPDTHDISYDALLPYVLARLPSDEELIGGRGYEVVFFAGGAERSASGSGENGGRKRGRPGWSWLLHAYHVLSRAMRKRLQRLYLVHERRWVRVAAETFSTVVSPKFRRKLVHCSTLSALALHLAVEDLLVPPTAYDTDRRRAQFIHVPYAMGHRAFGTARPLPLDADGAPRLPRVLRETAVVLLDEANVRTEGVFRINARMQSLDVLREAYDRGQKFIVWKEGLRVICFPQWKDGHGEVSAGDVSQLGGYGVYAAAGLTKMWYSKLREPLVPHAAYSFLMRCLDGKDLELPVLLDLVSTGADWSPLPKESHLILTMHLFPLLARIADHAADNKMTPSNLAVCVAPALMCGPDPIEDAKMSRLVAKVVEFAIVHWHDSVAESCGMGGDRFDVLLRTPQAVSDWEDPLSRSASDSSPPLTQSKQQEGIVLLDHEDSDSSDGTDPPPLPPRAQTQPVDKAPVTDQPRTKMHTMAGAKAVDQMASSIKRKPAPPIQAPPRYSTIITSPVLLQNGAAGLQGSPIAYQGATGADDMEEKPGNGVTSRHDKSPARG